MKTSRNFDLHRAERFWPRLAGLLARPPLGTDEALCLAPCASVHTCGMRYAIDVAFLSPDGTVLRLVSTLQPWRAAACFGAAATLEFRAGMAAALGVRVGRRVVLGARTAHVVGGAA